VSAVAAVALVAAVVVLVLGIVVLWQASVLRRQMEAFATEWREEMVRMVREAAALVEASAAAQRRAADLVAEAEADVEGLDWAVRALAEPVRSVRRLGLGVRRARSVFVGRRGREVPGG
jgi:hypothetical protein